MALFLSRFENKIDRKGRVSVPAQFRTVLASQAWPGIVAYPWLVGDAIEACGMDRIERLADGIDTFNPFSEEYAAFATSLLSRAHQLAFDSEGRVMLPPALIEHAGLSDMATFAGLGATFQIWNPEAYEAYAREAAQKAHEQANKLALAQRAQREAG